MFATVWLTLISGVILVKAMQDYWSMATRATRAIRPTRMRNALAQVGIFWDKRPIWTNCFAFVPATTLLIVFLTIGFKILSNSGLDILLRTQVGLAMGVTLGRLGAPFIKKADDLLQPFKVIYFVPIAAAAGVNIFGLYLMLNKCPEHLAEQWWMPCFHSPT